MRRFFALIAVASLLSFTAVAQDTPPPDVETLRYERDVDTIVTLAQGEVIPAPVPATPSVFGELAKQLLTPTSIASVIVALLGLIATGSWFSQKRKEQVAIVTQHAYNGVLDFSKTTETQVDDKIAEGLKIADKWMQAQGWRKLSDREQEVVKLGFNAIHGAHEAVKPSPQ